MNSERMLKELRYLRKRKIAKAVESENHVCLHFEDGSFCVFEAVQVLKDPPDVKVCSAYEHIGLETLRDLEIITANEYEAKRGEHLRRLEKYKELKAEFEGGES